MSVSKYNCFQQLFAKWNYPILIKKFSKLSKSWFVINILSERHMMTQCPLPNIRL